MYKLMHRWTKERMCELINELMKKLSNELMNE